jgi:alanyl-tRNA synthetase
VQRRIVRRAIRHGYKLGKKTPFFHKLVKDLVQVMGAAYPNLAAQEGRITEVLRVEEERFFETLATGMQILDEALAGGGDEGCCPVRWPSSCTTPMAFRSTSRPMYAVRHGVEVDGAGFAAAMEQQKAKGRAAGKFRMDKALDYTGAGNTFTGYEHLEERRRQDRRALS